MAVFNVNVFAPSVIPDDTVSTRPCRTSHNCAASTATVVALMVRFWVALVMSMPLRAQRQGVGA